MIPKFRAWDKDHKYMEYTDRNLIVSFGDNGNVDATDLSNIYSTCNGMQNFELMQSTGLKDINDTEIYEGDIVENIYKEIGFIKNCNDAFCFNRKERNFYLSGIGAGSPFKILGNIYENPELLEDN